MTPPADTARAAPTASVEAFRRSTLWVVIEAAALLSDGERGVAPRKLSNFLRGSIAPPDPSGPHTRALPLYGALECMSALSLEKLLDHLLEEGLIEPDSAEGSPRSSLRVRPTRDGLRCLRDPSRLSTNDLLGGSRLGTHPQAEARLWALRSRLAQASGRAPHGVFTNRTLAELADRAPSTLADLAEIQGIGEVRIARFGRSILLALRGSTGGRPGDKPRRPAARRP